MIKYFSIWKKNCTSQPL